MREARTVGLRYYRRRWEESRGDRYDAWGASTWLFEVDEAGQVIRQIEEYDNGPRLRYGSGAGFDDDFGGLSTAALDAADLRGFEIEAEDFELAWATEPWVNESSS